MQQQFTAIRLSFHHSLHIGSHREEYDRSDSMLHSDSLYSAIIAAWKILGVEHPVLEYSRNVVPRDLDLGFTISSFFPFFRENAEAKPVYFFPLPKPGLKADKLRRYKDIKWLDLDVFKSYLQAETNKEANPCGNYLTTHPGFIKSKQERKKHLSNFPKPAFSDYQDFMQSEVQPRAYVPRMDDGQADTVIFYIERIFFRKHSGLFGLAVFDNEEVQVKVKIALDYLTDAGIGTDRNVGHGQFEYEMDKFEHFADLPNSEHALNLSMFLPESKEQLSQMLDSEHGCHELMKRGGWITTGDLLSYRKDAVYMFREGGVFKANAHSKMGATVNLRPAILGHGDPVLRVGKSVFLPINF